MRFSAFGTAYSWLRPRHGWKGGSPPFFGLDPSFALAYRRGEEQQTGTPSVFKSSQVSFRDATVRRWRCRSGIDGVMSRHVEFTGATWGRIPFESSIRFGGFHQVHLSLLPAPCLLGLVETDTTNKLAHEAALDGPTACTCRKSSIRPAWSPDPWTIIRTVCYGKTGSCMAL